MSFYTSIGTNFWSWAKLRDLHPAAKLLAICLYTSANSKLICPGLYKGSIATMSEDVGMPADEVRSALDQLVEHEVVEYDQRNRVLRFIELPDTGESPNNGNAIRGWFKRFKSIPDCPVRNAHVATLRKLLDDWCTEHGKLLSHGHQQAWLETFEVLPAPPLRKKQPARQAVQQDLFGPNPDPEPTPPSEPSAAPIRSSNDDSERGSVSQPGSDPDPKEISNSEFITRSSGSGSGTGSGSGSFSSLGAEADPARGLPGDQAEIPRPRLALVPDPLTPERLVAKLAAGGRYGATVRQSCHAALCERIAELDVARVGDSDLALLAQYIARGYGPIDRVGGDLSTRLGDWASYPRAIVTALDEARRREPIRQEQDREHGDRSAALQEAMRALGWAKETVS